MKQFITFLAITVVAVSTLIFVTDYQNAQTDLMALKADTKEAAAGAILYYDDTAFSEGRYEINDTPALQYIRYQLTGPETSMKATHYVVKFYDDTMKCRTYNFNGSGYTSPVKSNFTYKVTKHTDEVDGSQYTVERPCCIIIAYAEDHYFRVLGKTTLTARSVTYRMEGY